MDLYIFRHGETDWNLEKRFQGRTDIPLNATGKNQAIELREKLRILPLVKVYSSDLSRALETAKIAFKGSISIHEELQEANLGEIERLKLSEIEVKYGQDFMDRWFSDDPSTMDFQFPKGESKREHQFRLQAFLEGLFSIHKNDSVGISTHGGSLRRILELCLNSPQDLRIKNCDLFHLKYDGESWEFYQNLS